MSKSETECGLCFEKIHYGESVLIESIYDTADEEFVDMPVHSACSEESRACHYTFAHTRHWCGNDSCRDR